MKFVTVSTHALAKLVLAHPYSICGSLSTLAEEHLPAPNSYKAP